MEKFCQESLVYQEKLFASKIPSLTIWSSPWTLPPNQKILLHKFSVLKEKGGFPEFMYNIQCFKSNLFTNWQISAGPQTQNIENY